MTAARALLLLVVALAALAGTAAAAHPGATLGDQIAGAPAQAELKGAHAAVDAALKARKQRLDAWQRAQKLRDAAAADVARLKKAGAQSGALDAALKKALALDEDATHARVQLLAAESDVASRGALLLKLYDAVLLERRRAVDGASAGTRPAAVGAYRDLAAQRDAVRAALLPVLPSSIDASAELPKGVDLDARADDDVETLLEKADLARDLEERFLRQAEAVRKRIGELEDEQAVAKGVSSMVGRSQLFDEEDRRLPAVRTESASATPPADHAAQVPTTSTARGGGTGGTGGAGAAAPPAAFDSNEPQGVASGPTEAAAPSSPFAVTSGGPTVLRTEQAMAAPADAAIAGLLSSNVSVDQLKALEMKLKARAAELDAKQKKLKAQAH